MWLLRDKQRLKKNPDRKSGADPLRRFGKFCALPAGPEGVNPDKKSGGEP